MSNLCFNPLISFNLPAKPCSLHLRLSTHHTRTPNRSTISCTRTEDSANPTTDQNQINLSVLRFTLGIPGLDESNLPRWIGYAFGSLLLVNHFVGSESVATTPAQLRTESLGLSLAGFSVVVPFIGKFLKGAPGAADQATIPASGEQIFAMSQNIADSLKEDLAWATYVLLRNTSTISVLVSVQEVLCVRGYWNTPSGASKVDAIEWFQTQIQRLGLSDIKETLYFPQASDSELLKMLPEGTCSILVQPVQQAPKDSNGQVEEAAGFILLASNINYAYNNKSRAWVQAVANKFSGKDIFP